MGLFLFLTVIQALVAAALVGVVLMQRSEGGGLGIGGSPTGALGARGAADFLTRATKWLAIAFVTLSIALAAVAVETSGTSSVSSTLDRTVTPSGGSLGAEDLLGEPAPGAGAGAGAPAADPLSDPLSDPLADPAPAPAQAPAEQQPAR
ncbi:MAG: preprotein translocase subunit SecG [Erythrobacter sp.]|jgi:preprotein translocase subunit SecG|nr:preprotein translocase subunit SecG [Erythrobacter sp.]